MIGRAGLQFGVFAFGLGFVLGTIRVLYIAPQLGEGIAIALELPVMLASCWWWAGRTVQRYRPIRSLAALAIGGIGFAVALIGELLVGILLFGLTAKAWVGNFAQSGAQLGLAAQSLLIVMPMLHMRRSPLD